MVDLLIPETPHSPVDCPRPVATMVTAEQQSLLKQVNETSNQNQTVPKTIDPPIPGAADWEVVETLTAVEALIAEVQQARRTTAWNAAIVLFWVVAVQAFRIFERQHLFEITPSAENLKSHETLLDQLIKLGKILETRIENIDDDDLAEYGVERANLSASIRELEDTLLMWHGPEIEPARAAELEKAIFGGTP